MFNTTLGHGQESWPIPRSSACCPRPLLGAGRARRIRRATVSAMPHGRAFRGMLGRAPFRIVACAGPAAGVPRYNVHPFRYGGLMNSLAAALLVKRMFAASHSSLVPGSLLAITPSMAISASGPP